MTTFAPSSRQITPGNHEIMINKNWIVTAVNALTGEREQISQRMNFADALAGSKKEIRRGPGRAFHDPRPEQVKPTKLEPVQLQFQFEPW